jgi:hypothetical protein
MVWIVNKSERAYNIGGVLVIPLLPVQIDDDFLNNERVKEIMADGDIETTSEPSGSETETNTASSDNKSGTSVVAKPRQQHDNDKQANHNLPPLPGSSKEPSASSKGS